MKKSISVIIILCFASLLNGQNKVSKIYNLLIGTYTASESSDGIYCYSFDTETGNVIRKSALSGVENPSYLAVSRDGNHVYAVNEDGTGSINSFLFDKATGKLSLLNNVSTGGSGPCYVSVDDNNKFVFAGNYNSGSLAAVSLKEDGSFGTEPQFIKHEGSSIDKGRQAGPHVHCTVLSPDNKYLLTSDLGTDKINIYNIDQANLTQPLSPASQASVSVKPGSGPRHITFHPDSKTAYLIQEMGSMITVFDYKNGTLTEKQNITMLAPDFKGRVGAADIHVSADGKFLYASNRGEANEIVIYSIGRKGILTYAGRTSTLGKAPRNFVIDPSGKFLLVANQDTNEIVFFKRDPKTGLITPTGNKIQVSKPVCLKFVSASVNK